MAFIRMSQRLGIPLARIRDALSSLPGDRIPTSKDWARLSAGWRQDLDDRILHLQRLRDNLTGCIGCGCLSLKTCPLTNPGDVLAEQAWRLPPLTQSNVCAITRAWSWLCKAHCSSTLNVVSSATARGLNCARAGSPMPTRCSTS